MKGKNKDIKSKEIVEDTTKYGENVSSFFHWISLDKQKDRAKELEDITKNKSQKKSNT